MKTKTKADGAAKKTQRAPMSLRLEDGMEKRLETCAAKLRMSKHALAQASVEALVEACEAHDYRLVLPLEFSPTHIPAIQPRTTAHDSRVIEGMMLVDEPVPYKTGQPPRKQHPA